jgi:hypothetical protein
MVLLLKDWGKLRSMSIPISDSPVSILTLCLFNTFMRKTAKYISTNNPVALLVFQPVTFVIHFYTVVITPSLSKESYRLCIRLRKWKRGQGPTKGCRSIDRFIHSFIHQWLYSLLLGPGLVFSFVIFFTQSVGLLGRVIRPSQGRYLHTLEHKHRINAYTLKHPCLELDWNLRSQRPSERRQFMP